MPRIEGKSGAVIFACLFLVTEFLVRIAAVNIGIRVLRMALQNAAQHIQRLHVFARRQIIFGGNQAGVFAEGHFGGFGHVIARAVVGVRHLRARNHHGAGKHKSKGTGGENRQAHGNVFL